MKDRRALRLVGGTGPRSGRPAPAPAAAAGARARDRNAGATRYFEDSDDHRLLRTVGRVDWIVVIPEAVPRPGFRLEMIDLDRYPQDEAALTVPFDDTPTELSVLGPVPYTLTAAWRQDEQRLVQHIWFAEAVAARVYLRNSCYRDVVVVSQPLPRVPPRRRVRAPDQL